ncbi:hypothetical protein [Mycolicibacterium phlei]|uniref:hypothetical protein n=1 Tax=Mycolicibacterium phlei TaxID=1771 RepID=UPI000777B58E|nr:hypothetical protein [Mycolicibacterium phlei]KXW72988.1 hypothetical protein MPHL43070_13310 [Mycolicibacterium phlei DSM 43070]
MDVESAIFALELHGEGEALHRDPTQRGGEFGGVDQLVEGQVVLTAEVRVVRLRLAADPSAARIAGKYPVVEVMPTEQVRKLPAGTPICVDGAWSGVHCSDLISADEKIRYEHGTEGGDSGGPVFVVDREGRATLIGIHRGHDPDMPTVGEATILAAALDHLDVTAVTG